MVIQVVMLAIAVFINVIELAPVFDWLAIVAMLMLFAWGWWRLRQLNKFEESQYKATVRKFR